MDSNAGFDVDDDDDDAWTQIPGPTDHEMTDSEDDDHLAGKDIIQ